MTVKYTCETCEEDLPIKNPPRDGIVYCPNCGEKLTLPAKAIRPKHANPTDTPYPQHRMDRY
jgi:DNA-directed RNA polymerase subunit RPC12/RpoP